MSVTLPDGLSIALPVYPTAADTVQNAQQVLQNLRSLITNYNPGGVVETYIEALAIALGSDSSTLPNSTQQGAYEILLEIYNAAFIATATGDALRLKCADVGVSPKPATQSNGSGFFTIPVPAPVGGTTFAAGTIVSSDPSDPTQQPVLFLTLADVTVPQNATVSPLVAIKAIQAGSSGNVDDGAITQVQAAVTATFRNVGATAGGTDDETDDSLRARGLVAIANASQCTISAIEADALSYAGITSAILLDNKSIVGGVLTFTRGISTLYVDDGSGQLASLVGNPADSTVQSVESYNQLQSDLNAGKWRSAGTQVNLVGSQTVNATIALAIDIAQSFLDLGGTEAQAVSAVQAAINGFVETLGLSHPLPLASVINVAKSTQVGTASPVSNVIISSVLINGSPADFVPQPQQVIRCANLASISVTVNAVTSYA